MLGHVGMDYGNEIAKNRYYRERDLVLVFVYFMIRYGLLKSYFLRIVHIQYKVML